MRKKRRLLIVLILISFISFGIVFQVQLKENQKSDINYLISNSEDGIPSVYYERFKVLGNVFSSEIKCEEKDCSDRPEVKYYLKIADVATRYKYKYNVNLNWVLLNATMLYSDVDEEATMKRALHDYDLDAVEDYDKLMDLDWDYDYKKIPGYTYLNPDDFRYDLQILAKNMVTKTTTQTCTKVTKDAEGNIIVDETKRQENIDVEDQYLKPGQEYYLKCDAGEEYNITSIYKYDAEKYDEFLLEYLERKYYMPSNGGNNQYGNLACLNQGFTKYDLTDEQLEQIASLAYHEQGTAKGAAAEASLMANLFELKGSSYGSGAEGLYNYVRNSGWFANAEKNMDSKDASPEIVEAVRTVLVDGKRTLPGYIDEHDWINDLTSVTNDGKSINKTDRSAYKQFETVIKNKYEATYTFYSFPDTNSDPFGYTSEENREEIGDFYYDYDSGQAMNCASGTNLSSAFVNLALSQQGVSGRPNPYTQWFGSIGEYGYSYEWCATFVSWAIAHTTYGEEKLLDIINVRSALVSSFAKYFVDTENFGYSASEYYGGNYIPKQGDLIFFDWDCAYNENDLSDTLDHIGIVVEAKDGVVYTIEGNTSDSVATRSYKLNSCEVASYGMWY